ncbi:hypothetical protein [Pleomorphomonas sp. JP5]|uniref:hypothetical protein n=1 Tax=Pleomorphomonas sp. JP5 TaxID=2942998 RepID=UPI00204326DD|nr:hypothetical protein [Pleomorphomonas sp. JP5]MCM5558061.1 hypothetical protein [Pleomorphomonas sp. JP5]
MGPGSRSKCWSILGIEPTDDERAILRAYAKSLKACRPDDDPEGFQRLVEAREEAMRLSARLAADPVEDSEDTQQPLGADEEDAQADNRATESSDPVLFESDPLDAVSIGGIEADEEVSEPTLLERAIEMLDSLLPDRAPLEGPRADNEGWRALFAFASELDLDASQAFHTAVAQRLPYIFPLVDRRGLDDVSSFERGEGLAALAELIERECQLNWSGSGLTQIVGKEVAERYLHWLAQAQAARELLNRRADAEHVYAVPPGGACALPADDVAVLVTGRRAKASFERSREANGRWPTRFDLRCLFAPVDILSSHGLYMPAFALAAFSTLLAVLVLTVPQQHLNLVLFGLATFVGLRIAAGFLVGKYQLIQLGKWVKEADRLGLLGHRRRAFLVSVSRLPPFAVVASAFDFLSATGILIGGLMLLPVVFNQDFLSQPAEATLDELALSLFETAATSDSFTDQKFAELLDTLVTVRSQAPRDEPWGAQLKDVVGYRDVISLRAELASSGEPVSGRLPPIAPRVERERKLRRVIEEYRGASPERRRELEAGLDGWMDYLRGAGENPRLSAAFWTLAPPFMREEKPTVRAVGELRGLLVRLFIRDSLKSSRGLPDFDRVPATLNALLNLPDEDLLGSFVATDAISAAGTKLRIAVSPKGYSASDEMGLSIDWPEMAADAGNPPWSKPASDWRFFASVADMCLESSGSASLSVILNEMASTTGEAAHMGTNIPPDYWRRAGTHLLDFDECRHGFMMKLAPDPSYSNSLASVAASQGKDALRSGRLAEARQIFGFVAEMSYSLIGEGDVDTQLALALASQSLQRGDIVDAVEYVDSNRSWMAGCPIRALRGFILASLDEKRRALLEFSAALNASGQKEQCGAPDDLPIIDLGAIRRELALLNGDPAKSPSD